MSSCYRFCPRNTLCLDTMIVSSLYLIWAPVTGSVLGTLCAWLHWWPVHYIFHELLLQILSKEHSVIGYIDGQYTITFMSSCYRFCPRSTLCLATLMATSLYLTWAPGPGSVQGALCDWLHWWPVHYILHELLLQVLSKVHSVIGYIEDQFTISYMSSTRYRFCPRSTLWLAAMIASSLYLT